MRLLVVVLGVLAAPVQTSDTTMMDLYNMAASQLGLSSVTSALGLDDVMEDASNELECTMMK